MIAIISALEIEVELLKASMQIKEIKKIASTDFYVGELFGKEVVVVKCGVGKVNSAMGTQIVISQFNPSLVINPGVAGGVGKEIKIGDLVIGTSCVQHDFDTSALGDPLGTIFTNKEDLIHLPCDEKNSEIFFETAQKVYDGTAHKGVIASGDQFISSPEKCNYFKEIFGAKACEMESGSIAQVCYLNDVDFVAIRSISDNAEDESKIEYLTFAQQSAHKTSDLLKAVFSL